MAMLLFSRVAFLSRCNFFVLHYFLVALFSCSTSFSLHSFYVALFRIALLSCFAISFSFHVFFVLYFFHVARTLFMSCYFQVALFCTLYFGLFSLHYFHAAFIFRVALFSCCSYLSCCTIFILNFLRVALFSYCTVVHESFQNRFSVKKL